MKSAFPFNFSWKKAGDFLFVLNYNLPDVNRSADVYLYNYHTDRKMYLFIVRDLFKYSVISYSKLLHHPEYLTGTSENSFLIQERDHLMNNLVRIRIMKEIEFPKIRWS